MDDKDQDYWQKKRRKIKSNIEESIESREVFLKKANGIRNNLDQAVTQVNDELDKLGILDEIYSIQSSEINIDPISRGSLDSIAFYSQRDAQNWESFTQNWSQVQNQTDSLVAAFNASGTMVPSMISGTYYLIAERTEPGSHYYQYTERLSDPSPQDRRKQLVKKLKQIEPYLATRLDGAWQTLEDRSKTDRISQSSTSIRELITGLLNKFASHEKVMKVWWYEQSPDTKRATRKQRILYAIMGNNKNISKKDFETIVEVVDDLYKEFDRLSKITHQQQYEHSLEVRIKGIIDQCQIHLTKLIELREIYFVEISS